jgi:hypothetical protein
MLPEQSVPPPECRSIEALDAEIVGLTARMTADEYELLTLIREFDERSGWLKWGCTNCVHWLHWRCDLSLSAAREKVRVAHALKVLPVISEAFGRGALSYSKVRALTRIADRANEQALTDFALTVSAALVEQHCQQLRNVRPDSRRSAVRAYERRALTASRNPEAGTMTLTVELPAEEGELVLNALDGVIASQSEPSDGSPSYRQRQADALILLCRDLLSNGPNRHSNGPLRGGASEEEPTTASTSDAYQVVVHVDADALSNEPENGARSDLPIDTVRRITCDGTVVPLHQSADGAAAVGRRRRTVSKALKRALLARDRGCRFPGCTNTRFIDAHHIHHWSRGGETSLDNLMLLCDHHHRLVHEGGFDVFADHNGDWCFRRPDGRVVPACGYRIEDVADDVEDDESTIDASAEVSPAGIWYGAHTENPSAEGRPSPP